MIKVKHRDGKTSRKNKLTVQVNGRKKRRWLKVKMIMKMRFDRRKKKVTEVTE